MADARTQRDANRLVSLADEEATREILAATVLDLWSRQLVRAAPAVTA